MPLITEINCPFADLDALRPLAPEQEQRVLQKFRLDWNYHSNAIEGNSLTLGETRSLLLHGLTAEGKPLRDHLDIKGHNEAILGLEAVVHLTTGPPHPAGLLRARRAFPGSRRTFPAFRWLSPSGQWLFPSVRWSFPGLRCAFPSVRWGFPAFRGVFPSSGTRVGMPGRRIRIPILSAHYPHFIVAP